MPLFHYKYLHLFNTIYNTMASLLLSTSAGIISMLDEPDIQLRHYALLKLNSLVDEFWAEISEYISKIEILQEDTNFKYRELAALVVSKVYYNLGEYGEALNYALEAGKLFNINESSEYVTTMISKCLDCYIISRQTHDNDDTIDPRTINLVDGMFQRCIDDGKYKQAIGIALEARRLDIIQKALIESDNVQEMLNHTFELAIAFSQNLRFRKIVLRELVNIYLSQNIPDYINICQCLIYLDDPQSLANIILKLVKSKNKKDVLMAYQLALDVYASGTQGFLKRVRSHLGLLPIDKSQPSATIVSHEDDSMELEGGTGNVEIMESETSPVIVKTFSKDEHDPNIVLTTEQESPNATMVQQPHDSLTIKEEICNGTKSPTQAIRDSLSSCKLNREHATHLDFLLTGDLPVQLELQFLIQNNRTDQQILKNSKDSVRNSICHNAVIIAHGFANCGTTNDKFLRNNLDWLAKATNWAKFTATASLGVVHKGHIKEALNIMSTYLPKSGTSSSGPSSNSSSSPYSEGGSLYAIGLINVNHGSNVIAYLIQQLNNATSEIIKHGACLGLGLAAISTCRMDVYEVLKAQLYQDDAVIGEAAGLAMGLVMLGSDHSMVLDDMITYAKETRHEKITRGLILGIALLEFGRMEQAETLIETLLGEKDALLRRCAVYVIATAYCGSANNSALKRLLHIAVSDVNDDVKRSAVTCIGFLLFQTPEQCPSIVSLLSESYNPHVRYGAALALGISCAGTGLKEAISMLEPLVDDGTNYVRQGALIASAMILIQQNEVTQPKSTMFREKYAKIVSDKHEEIMAKFGAIFAQGIIDAGGRNATINYKTGVNSQHVDVLAVVGTIIFTQFWFWYPFSHFLSLSFKPTHLVGLNADLKMPKIDFVSNAKPTTYVYPPMLEAPKTKEKTRLTTVVLSYAKGKTGHHGSLTGKEEKTSDKKEGKTSSEKDVPRAQTAIQPVEDHIMEVVPQTSQMVQPAKNIESTKKENVGILSPVPANEAKKKKLSDSPAATKKEKDDKKDSTVALPTVKENANNENVSKHSNHHTILHNPARVMPEQLKTVNIPVDCRYAPLKSIKEGGFIMLYDKTENVPEEFVPIISTSTAKTTEEDEGEEPAPPEPFKFIESE